MITVNPHAKPLDKKLIEAYRKIPAANLGHILDSAMDPGIAPLWRPIKLVGTALTVQTTPDSTAAMAKAVDIAQPGDVLVIDRAGEIRHATTGDFAVRGYMEKGIVGMVIDGLLTDRDGLERLKFSCFCRGVSAQLGKARGVEEGAVNVPVKVGGVTVSPGDMVLADENGVIVASPKEAQEHLAFCEELGEWEEWAIRQMATGRSFWDVRRDRQSYRSRARG